MNRYALIPLLALAAGCAVETNLDETESELAVRVTNEDCPDPHNCDPGNGGGVYTEENGFAGIGPNAFLITHFINNGSSVSLSGRRYNPSTQQFQIDNGNVDGAWYHGRYHTVLAVSEESTKPTWRIQYLSDPPFDVSGSQIVTTQTVQGLQPVLSLTDGSGNKQYTLAFSDYESESMTSDTHNTVTIDKTNMVWKATGSPMLFQLYCRLADGTRDSAVFQEGFAVNAMTADFSANSSYVTVACRQGGPPTVRLWGYTYGTTTTNRFQAALHMKRAAYCGDHPYYTEAGTHIKIYDPVGKQNDITTANYQNIEAVWTNQRAKCVNLMHLRHKAGAPAVGWPAGTTNKFDGWCADGTFIPHCVPGDLTGALLVSEASP